MRHKQNFLTAAFNVSTAPALATAFEASAKSGNHSLAVIAGTFAALNIASAALNVGIGIWGNRPQANSSIQSLNLGAPRR